MKNIFIIFAFLLTLLFTSCNRISDNPKEAASQYIEMMSQAAANRDFSKGEEITNSFLEKFSDNNAFFAALITELQNEDNKSVSEFMSSYDISQSAPIKDIMIHIIAVNKACEELNISPEYLCH